MGVDDSSRVETEISLTNELSYGLDLDSESLSLSLVYTAGHSTRVERRICPCLMIRIVWAHLRSIEFARLAGLSQRQNGLAVVVSPYALSLQRPSTRARVATPLLALSSSVRPPFCQSVWAWTDPCELVVAIPPLAHDRPGAHSIQRSVFAFREQRDLCERDLEVLIKTLLLLRPTTRNAHHLCAVSLRESVGRVTCVAPPLFPPSSRLVPRKRHFLTGARPVGERESSLEAEKSLLRPRARSSSSSSVAKCAPQRASVCVCGPHLQRPVWKRKRERKN